MLYCPKSLNRVPNEINNWYEELTNVIIYEIKLLAYHSIFFRDEWVSGGVSDLLEDKEEPIELFDKEDMSDMFSRAMFEKMQPQGEQTLSI